MIYEIFGGRDTIIKNLMKQFDSDGDLLNANGAAGMDVTGKGTSWQKLTNVSEDHRQNGEYPKVCVNLQTDVR